MVLAAAPQAHQTPPPHMVPYSDHLRVCQERDQLRARVQELSEKLNTYQAWEERRRHYDRIPNTALSAKGARLAVVLDTKKIAWHAEGKTGPQQISVEAIGAAIGFGNNAARAALDELEKVGHSRITYGEPFPMKTGKLDKHGNELSVTIAPLLVEVVAPDPSALNLSGVRNHGGLRCCQCNKDVGTHTTERRERQVVRRHVVITETRCNGCNTALATTTKRSEDDEIVSRTLEEKIGVQTPNRPQVQFESGDDLEADTDTTDEPFPGTQFGTRDESGGATADNPLPENQLGNYKPPLPLSMEVQALHMAGEGHAVFPICTPVPTGGCQQHGRDCGEAGKRPLIRDNLGRATTDPASIAKWWHRWPTANIGIACQASGLVVVDPDAHGMEAWRRLVDEHPDLSATRTVQTGGDGLHVYYRAGDMPVRNSASRIAPGIDVRGDGGYVVAPGSLHASGKRYLADAVPIAPFPSILREMVTRNRAPLRTAPLPAKQPTGKFHVTGDLIPEDRRNTELFAVASAFRGRGADGEKLESLLLTVNANRCRPPLTDDEVLKMARSVNARYPRGLRGGSHG